MKFIVDAQLPKSLARLLRELGHDAIHTLELPTRNRTGDDEINKISINDQRVLISKDSDFYDSYFGKKEPFKLLFLTCGNIRNADLLQLFRHNIATIELELSNADVVEMNSTALIVIQ